MIERNRRHDIHDTKFAQERVPAIFRRIRRKLFAKHSIRENQAADEPGADFHDIPMIDTEGLVITNVSEKSAEGHSQTKTDISEECSFEPVWLLALNQPYK